MAIETVLRDWEDFVTFADKPPPSSGQRPLPGIQDRGTAEQAPADT